jgi:hypothetical protein
MVVDAARGRSVPVVILVRSIDKGVAKRSLMR